MQVVIIKYNAGNIYSVEYALKRIGVDPVITDDEEIIRQADRIIFPGQGEALNTMRYLREKNLDLLLTELKQPLLGICIGMQLMCKYSEEGNTDCLGIFDVNVRKLCPEKHEDKIPHMGWNQIFKLKSGLFQKETEDQFVYFVHSFYVPLNEYTIATANYIQPFSAALQKDNFFATQFHPEKSGDAGEQILRNFINLK